MAVRKGFLLPVIFILSVVFLMTIFYSNLLPDGQAGARHNKQPRYIFVDLGANSADTLEVFLRHKGAKFEYDFPCPDWATPNQAEIYLFEANPHFNDALIKAKEHYDELGVQVYLFPSTVADIRDGTRTFFLDTVNTAFDYWGSSIYSEHPDVVQSKSNGTELSAINISRWLLMNTLPRDFVVVKMDIEGSEYEIIPHMAEMGVWSVVDHLLVEWHGAHQFGGTPEEIDHRHNRASAAKEKLIKEGVNMPDYNSGA